MTRKNTIIEQINEWGAAGIPFLFLIDFEQVKPLIFRLDEIDPGFLLYDFNGVSNIMDYGAGGIKHPAGEAPAGGKLSQLGITVADGKLPYQEEAPAGENLPQQKATVGEEKLPQQGVTVAGGNLPQQGETAGADSFPPQPGKSAASRQPQLISHPESYEEYLGKFNFVKQEIALGNTFLLNLTCSTPVDLNVSLREIFHASTARYRIFLNDEFVCFSPEIFVSISNGKIRSFPMKGTIDATTPDAENVILNDPKETAEHYTIVDLIRNDLSMVAKRVRVERFRYFDLIKTNTRNLLQVSSEICGDLDRGYEYALGDIIFSLLPAGSVSGAPKRKTTEIIAGAEGIQRGYYTGIAGLYDGHSLDSCVMIRFIEKRDNGYFYRSGGGITSFSDPHSEYREMIDKIYIPAV
jgi:para-aminobenzoate synthetase component 1